MSLKNSINNIFSWIKGDWNRALITALVFSLPFERIPSVDIYGITLRPSIFIGLAIISRFLYLILIKKKSFKIIGYQKLLIAFTAWLVLIIPESINFRRAFEVTAFNVYTIMLAFAVAYIFDKKYIKPIIFALFYSTVLICVYCLYQYIGNLFGLPFTGLRERYSWEIFGFPRIQGASLEPLYLASYMSIPVSYTHLTLPTKA